MAEASHTKPKDSHLGSEDNRTILSWLFCLLVVLTFVGYPIAGALSEILQLPSTSASYPFRGLMVAISLILIVVGLVTVRYRIALPVLTFLMIYLVRISTDTNVISFPDAERDLFFYVTAVLIPTIAVGISDSFYNERRTIILLSCLGMIASVLITYGLQNEEFGGSDLNFSRRAAFDSLNPITIGYTGLFTALAGVGILKHFDKRWTFPIAVLLIFTGSAVLILGGSRGPFVGLFLFLAIYALVRRHGFTALLMFIAFGSGLYITAGQDLALVQRLENSSDDASIWNRIYVQQASWDVAMQNPLFGFSYLEPTSLAYPHNLFIESGMALGVVGFLLMGLVLLRLILDSFTLLRNNHLFVPFVAVSAFANANLSASIFQSSDFWLASMLCWMAASNVRRRGGAKPDVEKITGEGARLA